jgi:hypothetical protein
MLMTCHTIKTPSRSLNSAFDLSSEVADKSIRILTKSRNSGPFGDVVVMSMNKGTIETAGKGIPCLHYEPRVAPATFVFNCMNTNPQIPIGDLSGEETELGVPTRAMVEGRAREIARLAERDPNKFTQADWERARVELIGLEPAGESQDPIETATSLSGRGSIPGESGSRAALLLPSDEAQLDERLASRGVEQAAHDQMVEAAKSDQKQEG